jgi:hypothetical protein
MKWRLPGPQDPAQAVRRPESSASAPAAKTHVHPIDLAAIDGVGDPVQRVADDPVAIPHAGCLQRVDHQISHSMTHSRNSRIAWPCPYRWICVESTARHIPRMGEHAHAVRGRRGAATCMAMRRRRRSTMSARAPAGRHAAVLPEVPVPRCCRIGCSTISMRVERPDMCCYVRRLLQSHR